MTGRSHRPLTVVAILLSMFMAAMEATVVATAMPTVISELHGLELYGWVGSLYMLATTVTIPLWGKLADLWGRKPTMLAGLACFFLGSLACGGAPSMAALIVFRAVQGVGAGALQPIAITMVGDLFTLQERSKIQGVFGAVWGFAAMVGPLLGGFLVKSFSWRWIFYVNLPICVLCAVLLVAFFRDPELSGAERSLDTAGAASLCLGVLSLLAAVAGLHPLVTLPLAVIAVAAFIKIEARAAEPLLPLSLFRIPAISRASVCGVLMGGVMMGTLMYTPLYVQAVRHTTPTEAGAAIAPMLIGWPIASALGGRILPRVGYRLLVRAGLGVVALATLVVYEVIQRGGSLSALRAATFLFGTGMGFANTALVIAVQESVAFRQRGVATASTMFFRNIGGTVATGGLGVLVAQSVQGDVSPHVLTELLGPTHGRLLDPGLFQRASSALAQGMLPVFVAIAILGALVALAGLTFPNVETVRSEPLDPAA